MSHPVCRLNIAGKPVSGLFMSRLVSCTVNDKAGVSNDTIDTVLEDGPSFVGLPGKGAPIICHMGESPEAAQFMGRFKVEQVDGTCFPHTLHITGKSADLRSEMKENKERHWDKQTVKQIIEKIASDHGLQAQVSGKVGEHFYEWFGQNDVSDIHLLENLARRHNALMTVKNGKLLFVERGSGQSASGTGLTSLVITPEMIVPGTFKFNLPDRGAYKEVKAYWQDKANVRRVEVKATSDDKAKAVHAIGEPFSSEAEAKKAADAKAKDLKRGTGSFSCTLVGNTAARGGAPVSTQGVRPGIDDKSWIIETASHRYSKDNYTVAVTAKLKV